jgi:hypothetical protein
VGHLPDGLFSLFRYDNLFQLTNIEWDSLRLQIETSKRGGRRYLPYAFTEQGVAMLSGLLNSDVAIEANISIMRAFVYVRQVLLIPAPDDRMMILENRMKVLQAYIEDVFKDQNDINEDTRMQLELLNKSLAELHVKHKGLITDDSRPRVGYTAPQYIQRDKE